MNTWLFNPFRYIAGSKALLIGLSAMMISAVIGYFSMSHFDGAIDFHVGRISPFYVHVTEQIIAWLCVTTAMFLSAKIWSASTIRLIDVAGTMALARWPGVLAAIIGFGIRINHSTSPEKLLASLTPLTVIYAMLSAVCMIWMIALMYNAFVVSCNMKGSRGVLAFIGSLIAAELLSKFILILAYKHLI